MWWDRNANVNFVLMFIIEGDKIYLLNYCCIVEHTHDSLTIFYISVTTYLKETTQRRKNMFCLSILVSTVIIRVRLKA